jgi:hypothetical protein
MIDWELALSVAVGILIAEAISLVLYGFCWLMTLVVDFFVS